jgi:hypothetical protein
VSCRMKQNKVAKKLSVVDASRNREMNCEYWLIEKSAGFELLGFNELIPLTYQRCTDVLLKRVPGVIGALSVTRLRNWCLIAVPVIA